MVRRILGVVILLVGIVAFAAAFGSMPKNVNTNFLIGYFLPSTLIVAVGLIVLMWKGSSKPA